MSNCYILMQTKSHAILLERRLKNKDILCEISYIPRTLSSDICNIALKLPESELRIAGEVLKRSGLPGYKVYREIEDAFRFTYEPVDI